MKPTTTYVKIDVNEELPPHNVSLYLIGERIEGKVAHPPSKEDCKVLAGKRYSKIPDKCEKYYDKNGFLIPYANITHWLKEEEKYIFSEKELVEHDQKIRDEMIVLFGKFCESLNQARI